MTETLFLSNSGIVLADFLFPAGLYLCAKGSGRTAEKMTGAHIESIEAPD